MEIDFMRQNIVFWIWRKSHSKVSTRQPDTIDKYPILRFYQKKYLYKYFFGIDKSIKDCFAVQHEQTILLINKQINTCQKAS